MEIGCWTKREGERNVWNVKKLGYRFLSQTFPVRFSALVNYLVYTNCQLNFDFLPTVFTLKINTKDSLSLEKVQRNCNIYQNSWSSSNSVLFSVRDCNVKVVLNLLYSLLIHHSLYYLYPWTDNKNKEKK